MPPRTLSAAACAGAFLLGLFVVCSWTIPGEGNRFAAALFSALREGGVAAAWWAGATGLGLWVVRWALRPAATANSDAAARVSRDDLVLGALRRFPDREAFRQDDRGYRYREIADTMARWICRNRACRSGSDSERSSVAMDDVMSVW